MSLPGDAKREPRTPAEIRTNTRRPDRVTLVDATEAYKHARDTYNCTMEASDRLVAARSNLCNAALTYVYGRAKTKEGK